jgi:two-component system response regulator FlrC
MSQLTILIVDDDALLRDVISDALSLEKYSVLTAENGEQALTTLKENNGIALILSDLKISPIDGDTLLKKCKLKYPDIPFILMSGHGSVENAVQAMHNGASDYLTKPFKLESLTEVIAKVLVATSAPELVLDKELNGFIAVDDKSIQLSEVSKRVALTDASVMISGESGVGKEVVSRFIHENSSRSNGPFVAINCAAIPENMLESELFGYEKGAFTGAYQSKIGRFEQAQGGTLLLDEITEMDLSLQAKLLRVLQEREVERLGGRKVISLDVRILATTNRNIYQAVSEGVFREDLFYRLNVFPLHISPLRDRPDDILPLANKILSHYLSDGNVIHFSETAKRRLNKHLWPGNVRELDNVIQRALILKTGDVIEAEDVHLENNVLQFQSALSASNKVSEVEPDLSGDLKAREQDLIISALKAKNSRKEVAERLGISSRTLRYKLAKMRDAGVAIPI